MTRDVLLLVEHIDGALEPITAQLIAQARSLAEAAGGQVGALLLAGKESGIAEQLDASSIDSIYAVEDDRLTPYNGEAHSRVAAEAIRQLAPGLFLCGHSFQGMEIAPWVAATLGVPLLSNCTELDVEAEELVAERLVHGQAWQVRLRLPWSSSVVASIARHGELPTPAAKPSPASLERLEIDLASLGVRSEVTGTARPEPGEVDISRADVVIGIGRGLRDPSNLPIIEDLAEALGGVVGCSRPLVDLEWLPYERQVGVSGKAIRPKLYVACGISGAAQHLAGIADAERIVAINSDANAPIFRIAHYGVVGDLLEIVPALAVEVRRRRANARART